MAYKLLLLTRAASRYDAVCTIDHLTTDLAHGDSDYQFYWRPFNREGELSRGQLIEASVRPIAELTSEDLAYVDQVVGYDDAGKLVKYSRGTSKGAPIPPLESLLKQYEPTWVGSMLLRFIDSQCDVPKPRNHYVYLKPGEKLFVMHRLVFSHTSFSHVVEECTIPDADEGLVVRWCAGIEPSEVCNLTCEGHSLIDGFELANEARLASGTAIK